MTYEERQEAIKFGREMWTKYTDNQYKTYTDDEILHNLGAHYGNKLNLLNMAIKEATGDRQ